MANLTKRNFVLKILGDLALLVASKIYVISGGDRYDSTPPF